MGFNPKYTDVNSHSVCQEVLADHPGPLNKKSSRTLQAH